MGFIPKNINIDSLCALGSAIIPKFKCRHILSILDLIIHHIYFYHYEEFDHEVPIHSDKFMSITHNYKDYLNFLIEEGIIIRDDHYTVGEMPKGYSFTAKYRCEVVLEDNVEEKKELKEKNKEAKKENYKNNQLIKNKSFVFSEAEEILTSFIHLIEIDNDEQNVTEVFNSIYKDTADICIDGLNDVKYLEFKKRIRQNMALMKIKIGEFYTQRDQKIGRYFTVLTHLKKEFRGLLTVNNQKLCGIDLCNSQPFLATVLLTPSFWYCNNLSDECKRKFNKYFGIITEDKIRITLSKIGLNENIESFINYDRLILALRHLDSDKEKYIRLVTTNKFYSHLEMLTQALDIQGLSAKDLSFTVLFSSNRTTDPEQHTYKKTTKNSRKRKYVSKIPYKLKLKAKKIFIDEFPTVNEVFQTIKSKDNSTLARILQRVESHLFLDEIVVKINKKNPILPIFTIHDSILVPGAIPQYIDNIASDCIERAIGHKPMFKSST